MTAEADQMSAAGGQPAEQVVARRRPGPIRRPRRRRSRAPRRVGRYSAQRSGRRRCRERPGASPRRRRRSRTGRAVAGPAASAANSTVCSTSLRRALLASSSVGELDGAALVGGEHQLDRRLGREHAPGGVDPRPQPKTEAPTRRASADRRRRRASARAGRAVACGAWPSRPARTSARFSSTSGTTSQTVASATRFEVLVQDTRRLAERSIAISWRQLAA